MEDPSLSPKQHAETTDLTSLPNPLTLTLTLALGVVIPECPFYSLPFLCMPGWLPG